MSLYSVVKIKPNPVPMALWEEQRADLDRQVIISCVDREMGIKEKLRQNFKLHMKASPC